MLPKGSFGTIAAFRQGSPPVPPHSNVIGGKVSLATSTPSPTSTISTTKLRGAIGRTVPNTGAVASTGHGAATGGLSTRNKTLTTSVSKKGSAISWRTVLVGAVIAFALFLFVKVL
jgi:hypothetical protein